MKKYAKIINNNTKVCQVGTGTNSEFYKSIGMKEIEVEQGFDGQWYVAGYAPAKVYTKPELVEYLYELKSNVAYTGITLVKDDVKYIFETNINSIALFKYSIDSIVEESDDFKISWKCWDGDMPVWLELTKKELQNIGKFAQTVINTTFDIEGRYNKQIQAMTDENLKNEEYINTFKLAAKEEFDAVNKEYLI